MPRGGYRPGAGRKPKNKDQEAPKRPVESVADKAKAYDDPMAFLTSLMNNPLEDIKTRADAAKALLPYTHAKLGEGGKKDAKAEAAKKAAGGRFASVPAPPRARVN